MFEIEQLQVKEGGSKASSKYKFVRIKITREQKLHKVCLLTSEKYFKFQEINIRKKF